MKSVLLALLLGFSLVGCKVDKKDPRNPHAPATARQRDTTTARPPEEPLPHSTFLNAQLLESPQTLAHPRFADSLQAFNAYVIQQRDINLLNRYTNMILWGCQMDTLNGCRLLHLFERDRSGTVQVLKVRLQNTTSVLEYYRLLRVAIDLKNKIEDPELTSMILKRMGEFLTKYVLIENRQRQMSPEIQRIVQLLTLTLADHPEALPTDHQITQLTGWMLSPNASDILGRPLVEAYSNFILKNLNAPVIWKAIVASFQEQQKSSPRSYTNALKRIKKASPKLLDALGLEEIPVEKMIQEKNPALFGLIFFTQLIDLQPAQRYMHYWKLATTQIGLTMAHMTTATLTLLVDQTLTSNARMAKYFNEELKKNGASKDLLDEAIRVSNESLATSWKDLVSRVQNVEKFVQDVVSSQYREEPNFPRLRAALAEFNPAIKYFAIYPNMIMLGYFAKTMNYSGEFFDMMGRPITIDKNVILHELFDGKIGPLFSFTSYQKGEGRLQSEPIDRIQMMWSLYFLLATDLPKAYKLSNAEFLTTLFSAYREYMDAQIQEYSPYLEVLKSPNSRVGYALQLCGQAPGVKSANPLQLEHLYATLAYGKAHGAHQDGGQSMESLAKAFLDIANTQSRFDEGLEIIRSSVDPQMRMLQLLQTMMKKALPDDQAAQKTVLTQLHNLKKWRQDLLQSIRGLVNGLSDCLFKLDDLETARRFQVLEMEADFLNLTAKALNVLQTSASEAVAIDTLRGLHPFFQGLQLVNGSAAAGLNEVYIRNLKLGDAFSRIQDYESSYRSESGFRRNSDGTYSYNYKRTDLLVRVGQYLRYGFLGKRVASGPDNVSIVYPRDLRNSNHFSTSETLLSGDSEAAAFQTGIEFIFNNTMWFRTMTFSTPTFRSLILQKTALFKVDYLDLYNLPRAERRAKMTAEMAKLFDISNRILKATTLNSETKALLDKVRLSSFVQAKQEGMENLFVATNASRDYLELFDETFSHLTSFTMGEQYLGRHLRPGDANALFQRSKDSNGTFVPRRQGEVVIARPDFFRMAEYYYLTLRDKDRLLVFAIPEEVQNEILRTQTYPVHLDLEMANLMIELVPQYLSQHSIPLMQFSLLRAPHKTVGLTPGYVGVYVKQVRDFHEKTNFVFSKGMPDP